MKFGFGSHHHGLLDPRRGDDRQSRVEGVTVALAELGLVGIRRRAEPHTRVAFVQQERVARGTGRRT